VAAFAQQLNYLIMQAAFTAGMFIRALFAYFDYLFVNRGCQVFNRTERVVKKGRDSVKQKDTRESKFSGVAGKKGKSRLKAYPMVDFL
jgi:hypothetical protein